MSLFRKKIFGLDISDDSIRVLLLKKKRGNFFKIASFGKADIKPGLVENGKILDAVKLAEEVRKLLKKTKPKKIKTRNVIVNLPESKSFSCVFELPANLKDEEIASVIKNESQELIPFEPENVFSDYNIIKRKKTEKKKEKTDKKKKPESNEKGINKIEAFYAAAEHSIIAGYYQFLKLSHLKPVAIDLESNALARSLVQEIKEPFLIIDIGARTTDFNIFDKTGNCFSSSINIAGNNFTEILAEKLGISKKEAESKKKKIGLDIEKGQGKVMQILQSAFPPIIEEAKKTINFYERKHDKKIKKIYLTGGSALMPDIDEYLSENVGVKAVVGKPWVIERLKNSKKFNKKDSAAWNAAIGLALRGLEKNPKEADVNLLPREKELKIKPKVRKQIRRESIFLIIKWSIIGLVALVIASGLFGLIYWWEKIPFDYFKSMGEKRIEIPVQKEIDFEFSYNVHTKEGEGITIGGEIYERTAEGEKTFSVTEGEIIEKKAAGTATIINNSGLSATLVANTRLLSEGGVLFRTEKAVNLPANGNVEVEIYADEPGEEGEIAPTTFTIPGLSSARQDLIYAESSEPTTGGVEVKGVITQDNLTDAQGDLESELIKTALEDLREEMPGQRRKVLSNIIKKEILEKTYSHGLGAEVSEFTLEMEMKIYALAIFEDIARVKAGQYLESQFLLPTSKTAEDYKIKDLEYKIQRYDLDEGNIVLDVKGRAELIEK